MPGERLQTLRSLVPAPIQRFLVRAPRLPQEPASETLPAAIIFADISGFTDLTERLAEQSERGAEEVQRILNLVFGLQIDQIDAHGGEVWGFAGDATLAVWRADERASDAVLLASQCAMAIRQAMLDLAHTDGVELSIRTVVGTGSLRMAFVGGDSGRWQGLLTGSPLGGLGASLDSARPGDVVLSPAAWRQVRSQCEGDTDADGGGRLATIPRPIAPTAAEPTDVPAEIEDLLWAFVPRSVRSRVDAGQFEWLAEYRRLTAMFVNVTGLDERQPGFLTTLHRAIRRLQEVIHRYGGSVNQVMVDDKGTSVVAGWGLAGHTHEDDPVRATLAALAIGRALGEIDLEAFVGVSTGRAFTGMRGNARRAEYAMIGDTVNLAARLMSVADPVLCDEATRAGAEHRIQFESLPAVQLKGKQDPVPVARPLAEGRLKSPGGGALVGRMEEYGRLFEALDRLQADRVNEIVLVEGEPGIGKSRLLATLLERSRATGVRTYASAADTIERATPYFAWRDLINQLLGLEEMADPRDQRRRVEACFESITGFGEWASLLNPMLPFDFPTSETAAEMSPKARAETARGLLAHLFRGVLESEPALIAIDDAQWMDTASWALVEALQQELSPLLLVLTARLAEGEHTGDFQRFLEPREVDRLQLRRLPRPDVAALLEQSLAVRSVPESVVELVWEKAEGHPLFSEELAYALRDRKLLRIEGDSCRTSRGFSTSEAVRFPDTVQGVVTHRIDNLSPAEQLTLKVASVVGRTFRTDVLRDIHPIADDRTDLEEQLETLARLDLIRSVAQETQPTFTFKHAITQEVSYGLLPYAQRRRLHRTVAELFEVAHDFAIPYAVLAYHWRRAEAPDKAIFYLDKAGEEALVRDYANEKATRFLGEAVALVDEHRERLGDTELSRASRYRMLGEAYFNLGEYGDGLDWLSRALGTLESPEPRSSRARVRLLVRELLRQVGHRLHRRGAKPTSEASPSLLEAARAYSRLGSIYYVTEEQLPFISSLLSALNVAEHLGPTPELALAYANMGNVAGHIPIHGLARAYGQRALRSAEEVDRAATTAMVLTRTSIYRVASADWRTAEPLERAMEIADRLNNNYQWEESGTIRSFVHYHQGEFAEAAELGRQVFERAQQSKTPIHQLWGLGVQAQGLIRLGAAEHAVELAESMLGILEESTSVIPDVALTANGNLATAYLEQGELDLAVPVAKEIDEALAHSAGVGYMTAPGLVGLADVLLALWAQAVGNGGGKEVPARAISACRDLRRYAKRYRSALPGAFLRLGRASWLQGRRRRARRLFHRSRRVAAGLAMPYDEGLAHYELARCAGPGEPARLEHQRLAHEIFNRLGTRYDRARTQALAAD